MERLVARRCGRAPTRRPAARALAREPRRGPRRASRAAQVDPARGERAPERMDVAVGQARARPPARRRRSPRVRRPDVLARPRRPRRPRRSRRRARRPPSRPGRSASSVRTWAPMIAPSAAGMAETVSSVGHGVSFWHSALDAEPVRPPLGGPRSADVCIVGAGYTGLWTAYELRARRPALDIVVLEAEMAGFGASGRNGGWVLGALPGRASTGRRADGARRDRPGARDRGDGRRGRPRRRRRGDRLRLRQGRLAARRADAARARRSASSPRSRSRARGSGDDELLDAAATAARVGVAGALGASFTPHCARVQPAKLARGLAHAAERAGAVICEGTRATRIAPGRVDTPHGIVRAPHVVRATEGYTAGLPGLRRVLLRSTAR